MLLLIDYLPQKERGVLTSLSSIFESVNVEYPHRRISNEDNDIKTVSLPGTKRSGLPDDSLPSRKKLRNDH